MCGRPIITTCTESTLRPEHRFASMPIPALAHAVTGPVAPVAFVDRLQLQEELRSFSNSLRTPTEPVNQTEEEAGVAEVLAASTGLQECSICVTATAYVVVDECNHSMCGAWVGSIRCCTPSHMQYIHSDVCASLVSRITQGSGLPVVPAHHTGVSLGPAECDHQGWACGPNSLNSHFWFFLAPCNNIVFITSQSHCSHTCLCATPRPPQRPSGDQIHQDRWLAPRLTLYSLFGTLIILLNSTMAMRVSCQLPGRGLVAGNAARPGLQVRPC